MAVKGSGGHGGRRAGAGRKVTPAISVNGDMDMLNLLQDIALGRIQSTPLQLKAAIAAVQYTHTRKGYIGKKASQMERAHAVAESGRFRPRPLPNVPNMDDYR